MLSFLSPRRLARTLPALAAAMVGLAGLPAHADIYGKVLNKATGQPFTADEWPWVEVRQCNAPGDTLCGGYVSSVEVAADGSYRIPADSYSAGARYQVWAGALWYKNTGSKPFAVKATEDHVVDMPLAIAPVTVSDMQSCSAVDADGFCEVRFTLQNNNAKNLSLQAWVMVSTTAFMPAGWSQFASDDGDGARNGFKLAASETRELTQKVYVGRNLPRGAYAQMTLNIAPKGQPQKTLASEYLPTVVADGANGLVSQMSPAETQRLERTARARRGVLAAKLSAEEAARDKRYILSGSVVAADTGGPVASDAGAFVRLMACNRDDDTYCMWIQGDPLPMPADGKFYVRLNSLPAGRYQIHVVANQHYGMVSSASFEAPATASTKVDLTLPRLVVDLEDVQRCTDVPVADCKLGYTLRNTTSQDQTLLLWLYTNPLQSESQVGSAIYSIGKKGNALGAPMKVTIPAGQTKTVHQPVGMTDIPGGASGWFRLYLAAADDIAHAEAYFAPGNYTIATDAEGVSRITVVPRPDLPVGVQAPRGAAGKSAIVSPAIPH